MLQLDYLLLNSASCRGLRLSVSYLIYWYIQQFHTMKSKMFSVTVFFFWWKLSRFIFRQDIFFVTIAISYLLSLGKWKSLLITDLAKISTQKAKKPKVNCIFGYWSTLHSVLTIKRVHGLLKRALTVFYRVLIDNYSIWQSLWISNFPLCKKGSDISQETQDRFESALFYRGQKRLTNFQNHIIIFKYTVTLTF